MSASRMIALIFLMFIVSETALASGVADRCAATSLPAGSNSKSIVVSGHLGYRALNNEGPYHAADWTVESRWVLANGDLELAHEQIYTRHDGMWSLPLILSPKSSTSAQTQPIQLKLIFSPQSHYVSIGDRTGKPHQFEYFVPVLPFNNMSCNFTIDLSETSNKYYFSAGLGDVFDATRHFFERITQLSNNPEYPYSSFEFFKNRRIRIYYPNTWYDCHQGDGRPYSCADDQVRSEIWIARDHIVERPHQRTYDKVRDKNLRDRAQDRINMTVMHELAHELNSRKWNYAWPKSDGKKVPECPETNSDKRLTEPYEALTEGFATALAALIQYGIPPVREVMAFEYKLERPGRTECDKLAGAGAMQATWVAAAFWDMIDSDDGQDEYQDPTTTKMTVDKWQFPDPFTPFHIYLQDWTKISVPGCPERGVISDVRDCRFLSYLRDASKGEVDIEAIFQHNNILP